MSGPFAAIEEVQLNNSMHSPSVVVGLASGRPNIVELAGGERGLGLNHLVHGLTRPPLPNTPWSLKARFIGKKILRYEGR